jgi:O-antigen/teichoic acid export membrane protein
MNANMINKLSDFSKNALIIGLGTFISQLIPFLILPILTRIYSKSDFGVFTSYTTAIAFVSILVNARYDFAILLPKEDSKAIKIFNMAIIIAFFFVCFVCILCLIIRLFDITTNFLPAEYKFIYVLPFITLALGMASPLNFLSIRFKLFYFLSLSKIIRSLCVVILSIIIGYLGISKFGLVIGDILGQLIASFVLLGLISKKEKIEVKKIWQFKIEQFRELAKEYIKFPKYSIPSAITESAGGLITVILLTSNFKLAVLGSFGFAQRVIVGPSTIIAKSIGDVFRQSASKSFAEEGHCTQIFISTFKNLLLISIFPFLFFLFFSPTIFKLIFGQEWIEAGEFAQIMSPMFALQFIAYPLGNLFIIAEKQNWDFILQIFLITSLVIGLYVGIYIFQSIRTTLMIYTFIYCLKYSFEIIFSYKFAQRK